MHDLSPASSPFRRAHRPVDRGVNSGFPEPWVWWCSPTDPFPEKEMDKGFSPSAGAACFGVRIVPPPVVVAEVTVSRPMLHKFAENRAG